MASRSWTLRRRVTALCVVVGTVLGLLGVAEAVVANENRRQIDLLLNKAGPLRVDAEVLLGAFVDQETGVRGYAVSGNRADLAPYEEGIQREQRLVVSMERMLDGYPEVWRQVREVQAQAQEWRRTVAVPVIEATSRNGTAAGQALLDDRARQRFDQLRDSTAAMQGSILALRTEIAEAASNTGNQLVLLLFATALVVVLAGVSLLLSLNRLVIGPLSQLTAQVRQVAGGDHQRAIERIGPPELAQLAGDVEAMRQRIAADLAEVREARTRIEWVNSQLEKQAEELVRSNRDLEQFAYVASHDLQEPLRKVASFCQLLQRRYAGQLDERADQYIAFAVDGAQRMQRLINDLLAFSRIGRLTSGFTDVDMNKVMGDVAAQTEAARQYADGELTWSDLPVICGEEPLLTNLIANLVSNALKFRRPDVPPRVHVSARRVADEWEITCQDNGIGIEAEFAEKIFVIFQRLHSKDAYPGTGIGLAIAKKIVEYHGGRIWVDVESAEGTAIRFTLPVRSDGDATAATDIPAATDTPAATDIPAATDTPATLVGQAATGSGAAATPEPGGMKETVA